MIRKIIIYLLISTTLFVTFGFGTVSAQSTTPPAAVISSCTYNGVAGTVSNAPINGTWGCQLTGPFAGSFQINPDGTVVQNSGQQFLVGAGVNYAGKSQGFGYGGLQTNCSLTNMGDFWNQCIWIPGLTAIGSLFLFIGGTILREIGYIFDTAIWYFVVDFSGSVKNTGFATAITLGWTLCRNLANIVIIGMFTFIALSIILGIKEYGQKKLIANVLIVAIFINFSLLFTQIVVDFSNYTAYQFYTQIASQQSQFASPTQGGAPDIASGFLRPMGTDSVFDSGNAVTSFANAQLAASNAANSQQQGTGTSGITIGLQSLLFGLVGGFLLIAIALVLAYGCFLMFERGLVLIFLMFTSAIAFTTYLHPSLSKAKYGFSAWLSALINAALFAPLLMIFLWITQMILAAGSQAAGSSTMGSIINDPSKAVSPSGWATIILYIVGIGFLYISFKVANSVASAGSVLAVGSLAKPLVGPGGSIGDFAYRNLVGRLGSVVANRRVAESKDRMIKAGQAERVANQFNESDPRRKVEMDRANRLQREAANKATGLLTRTAAALGKGYDDALKKRVKAGSERAAAVIKPADISAARKAEEERIRNDRKDQSDMLKATFEEAKKSADNLSKPVADELKKNREELAKQTDTVAASKLQQEIIRDALAKQNPEYAQSRKEIEDVGQEANASKSQHEKTIKTLNENLAQEKDAAKANEIKDKIAQTERERESQMRHESDRINKARTKIDEIERSNTGLEQLADTLSSHTDTISQLTSKIGSGQSRLKEINALYSKQQDAYEAYTKETDSLAKEAGNLVASNMKVGAIATAGEIGKGGILDRINVDNEKVASGVRHDISHKLGEKSLADTIKEAVKKDTEKESEGGGDHH